ncbi:hypothetical protein FB567DRAFT_444336 [Paraphoma chrysanthemicola]|uniref:Capsule polysaccharide biosynthesis protein n=1 Tax=Paraphoma chrysanthemicola TaxID=798071 RepID=A0A8K0VX94_9PLEO|nr:hypothetical protein FB567DRAFT_444336 [Paraphoma chrysanthemicola]
MDGTASLATNLWIWTLIIFLILNSKCVLFKWHYRFFHALWKGIRTHQKTALRSHDVFLPTAYTSHVPLLEIDFNLHKSNSTYFSDLDVARAYHTGVIFGSLLTPRTGRTRCNFIVGAVSCTFKREIKLYSGYELSTKVASWDEKWIYMVTHFVERGKAKPQLDSLQDDVRERQTKDFVVKSQGRRVFASAVTRMVCKRGRITVSPIRALEECGLFCDAGTKTGSYRTKGVQNYLSEELEDGRKTKLPIVQLQQGWDKVHELFDEQETVLGRITDVV